MSEHATVTAKAHPKVLIVDDNDLMRTLLRGILRHEEYQIIGEAKNGVIALDLVERLKPDIICMDVMMPEMDGLAALQSIKAAHPEIIVVMITGNASVENVQGSIQGGASGFIVKPFNAAKVLGTLDRAWRMAGHPPAPAANT
ncbi:MAG: response regulator [Betaproteobacteria bacterium]|nr:response regulator [Betaproteobacteria bacterium]